MNVTKLKLKIKESKEVVRHLTIEEQCIYLAYLDATNPNNLRLAALKKLDDLHMVKIIPSDEITNIAVFRTETIRDATPKEIIAWHCLESYKECDRVDDTCYACPLNVIGGICVPRKCEERSKKVLEGKEVILSVNEE